MAFTEFCCRSGGSNMNGGALASNGEPATSPVYSATNGGWNSGTGVFTPTSGNPSLTVSVGDWAHVFTDGSSTLTRIARVTAVNSTTVTLSTSAGAGTAPTTAGTGISINVGGAWGGPSGSVIFPFGFVTSGMTNAAGNQPRINFKNNTTYSPTASCAQTTAGPITWQGYTTTFGDLGKATIDAGGSAIVIVNFSATQQHSVLDLIVANNGSTNVNGIAMGNGRSVTGRIVAHDIGGIGISNGQVLFECEAYLCNVSNTSGGAGISCSTAINCISHDNAGSNSSGIIASFLALNCIADTNGQYGIQTGTASNAIVSVIGCDAYNNGASGIRAANSSSGIFIKNCNVIKNGTYGIDFGGASGSNIQLQNNGYGSGAMANTTADTNAAGASSHTEEVGKVTYGSGLTPWVDPTNGDFRISLAAAKGAGRGAFTQTQGGYAGSVGYPDIGAAQHQETGGGGGGQRVISG